MFVASNKFPRVKVAHDTKRVGLACPQPKLLNGSILIKFLLGTRLKSESFDTLDDLLGFR